jgi:alpha-glucoside transport system substrate-binding protein
MAHRRRGWRAAVLLGMALTLVAAGCADDDDGDDSAATDGGGDTSGTEVSIFGPEVEGEAQGFVDAFAAFEEETGIKINYEGDRSFEE